MVKYILTLLIALMAFSNSAVTREEAIANAKNANSPHFDMMYASNVNILSRCGMNFMTSRGKYPKACINTVTSFYNKKNTCSSCRDFVKHPERWNFEETTTPIEGDIVIYFKGDSAYHAGIIVSTHPLKMNHASGKKYLKNKSIPKYIKCKYYTYK